MPLQLSMPALAMINAFGQAVGDLMVNVQMHRIHSR